MVIARKSEQEMVEMVTMVSVHGLSTEFWGESFRDRKRLRKEGSGSEPVLRIKKMELQVLKQGRERDDRLLEAIYPRQLDYVLSNN